MLWGTPPTRRRPACAAVVQQLLGACVRDHLRAGRCRCRGKGRSPSTDAPWLPQPHCQLYGVCLGMEALSVAVSKNHSILSDFDSENLPSSIFLTGKPAARAWMCCAACLHCLHRAAATAQLLAGRAAAQPGPASSRPQIPRPRGAAASSARCRPRWWSTCRRGRTQWRTTRMVGGGLASLGRGVLPNGTRQCDACPRVRARRGALGVLEPRAAGLAGPRACTGAHGFCPAARGWPEARLELAAHHRPCRPVVGGG